MLYLHPTGGRPIIPFPPFLIITYEMTILFGILATVIGFLISARLPAIRDRAYAPEAAVDRFAVAVTCDDDERVERAAAILREAARKRFATCRSNDHEAYSASQSLALALLAQPMQGWSFPWNKDMVDQPAEKPQKSLAPPPPKVGTDHGTRDLAGAHDGKRDIQGQGRSRERCAIRCRRPPTRWRAASTLYQTNCVVCHGERGHGDGPVGRKFDPVPVDLNKDYTQSQADGQLFFTLTRGRVAMPFYRDALSQQERWDVINYVKSEFGKQSRPQ